MRAVVESQELSLRELDISSRSSLQLKFCMATVSERVVSCNALGLAAGYLRMHSLSMQVELRPEL